MCLVVKYALFVINLVFTLSGLAVAALGVTVLVFIGDLVELIPKSINAIPISLIVIGAVIILIAVFGCCGAIKQSVCLLSMYAICMLLLAGGNIYIAVVIFGAMETIHDSVADWLGLAFNDNSMRPPYHAMEVAFRCCGTTGADSYAGILPQLPPSCCLNSTATRPCTAAEAFQGCNDVVGEFFEIYIDATGGVIVTIIIIELMGTLLGLCLCSSARSKQRIGAI